MIKISHIVKCLYCSQTFDADKEEFIKPNSNRFAHKKCYEDKFTCEVCKKLILPDEERKLSGSRFYHIDCFKSIRTDKDKLYDYINSIFNTTTVNPKVQKEIEKYIKEYNYTYTGILSTLKYWYEVKHSDVSKAHGRIGIVPYIYQEAYNYNYQIWAAQQQNKENNKINKQVREIIIKSPKAKLSQPSFFNFLDGDDI